ncbi:hypothetical protein WN48_01897 [Eufriesea mexicana]|nr:hypothetical protein WN48_01897 [Eufriesea mexicana]
MLTVTVKSNHNRMLRFVVLGLYSGTYAEYNQERSEVTLHKNCKVLARIAE